MKSEFDYYCKNKNKKAKQVYAAVGWSGDKLPVCSCCGQSPYEGRAFKVAHKEIIKTKGA